MYSYMCPHPLQPIDCRMYDLCGICNGDDSSADVVTGSSSQHGTIGKYIPCSHKIPSYVARYTTSY